MSSPPVLTCPHCGLHVRLQLSDFEASVLPDLLDDHEVPTTAPEPVPEPEPTARPSVQTLNVRTPISQIVSAPEVWTLPMAFRQHNPWGYLHGQVTSSGQYHAGYDLNNGPTGIADLGDPLYAARPGTVVYAKRTPGWGTLLAVLMDESVDGRRVCYRYGHPDTILVQWGEHVEAGQLIATCGDGKMPQRYSPHLHYDVLDIEVLWEVTQGRGIGKPDLQYYGQGMDRGLFERLYIDPRRFHPEIDAALKRVGK